ncbi:hypothetical protein C8J56DRAFT_1004396 [Mycena floridula]|nr:hypothetical protein C8J56DRAFT_1004396 [Mycena floridula]
MSAEISQDAVIEQFHQKYHNFNIRLQDILVNPTDSFQVLRAGEQLEEFRIIIQEQIHTGSQGHPRTVIDHDFLQFAYPCRTTVGIAHFLGVEPLEQGIAQPGVAPTNIHYQEAELVINSESNDLLEPDLPLPQCLPSNIIPAHIGPHTEISVEILDALISQIHLHFRCAGTRMLHGSLHSLEYHIQFERIRHSLLRIDPVHRIFDRIRIRRRGYTVPGPNSLWHHDGQQVSLHPETLFRSVHNVRIEHLWVDVTAQVGGTWASMFDILELWHGLDINNQTLFAGGWNRHSIQIQNGPNRSPENMFGFDSDVQGFRGHQLDLTDDELEVYGIDWEDLNVDRIRASQLANNPQNEDTSSWIGRTGPPPRLSEVRLDPPDVHITIEPLDGLDSLQFPYF